MSTVSQAKEAEHIVLDFYSRRGAAIYRVRDASDINGLTQGQARLAVNVPADFVLHEPGYAGFLEVKSTSHKTSFAFSLYTPANEFWMKQVDKTGNSYLTLVERILVSTKKSVWYRIPSTLVMTTLKSRRKSLGWTDLEGYIFHELTAYANER